ncbi:MAG: FAD-dependent oxidoreductase [Actinobacteria bacterium]|nr:FAD-dependent oxidoreductase [Actinomycetota bacterium]
MKDLVILGAGPAGLTASIYAARKMLDFLVLTKDIGGQAMWSVKVENYLGYTPITGLELVNKFEEHVKEFGIEIVYSPAQKVEPIPDERIFLVHTEDGKTIETKSVIVATGKSPRYLNVPGEKEHIGRGIAFCATCDAPLFAGQNVAVVGGGNAALDAAMQLTDIAKQVYVVSIEDWTGDPVTQKKLESKNNLTALKYYETLEVIGDGMVKGLVVRDRKTGEEKRLDVTGVFVEIGSVPNSYVVEGVCELNNQKEIVINCYTETSYPGIFAAGDVSSIPDKQIIIAAGEGAKAALRAYEYLLRRPD